MKLKMKTMKKRPIAAFALVVVILGMGLFIKLNHYAPTQKNVELTVTLTDASVSPMTPTPSPISGRLGTPALISTNADASTDFQPYTLFFNFLLKGESRDLGELTGRFRVEEISDNVIHISFEVAFSSRGSSQDSVTIWFDTRVLLWPSTEGPPPIPPPTYSSQLTLTDGENILYFSQNRSIENSETTILEFWFGIGNMQVNSRGKLWAMLENQMLPSTGNTYSLLSDMSGKTENQTGTVIFEEIVVPTWIERNLPLIAGILVTIAAVGIVVALYIRRTRKLGGDK